MGKEISIPIATEEVFREGGKRFIVCQPQVSVLVEEAYANSEFHRLDKPIRAHVGQLVWFPVVAPTATSYDKSTVCGIIATEIDPTSDDKPLSKCPIAGVMMGDVEAGAVTIGSGSSSTAQFAPQVGCAIFKKFDLKVKSGDSKKVFFSDLRIGTKSIFLSPNAIPFDVMTREGAVGSSIIFSPGVLFSIAMVNMGEEPVVIEGNLVFEEVDAPKTKDAADAAVFGARN
jgi:hypothetical protein